MGDTRLLGGTRVRLRRVRRTVPVVPRTDAETTSSETETYRAFTDMPSGSNPEFAYSGDGAEQVRFFSENSNFDELIRSMNRADHDAFDAWMRGNFMHGQQYRGFDNMDSDDQNMTRSFDKILDRSELRAGVTLRRLATAELVLGAGNRNVRSLAQLQALQGRVVTSNGSMSTAAAGRGLGIGSGYRKQVEYIIHIPAGAKGAGMWIGDRRIGGWGAGQREFMTNRDIAFTIGSTKFNSRTGKYEVELTFAGRLPHDYGRRGR